MCADEQDVNDEQGSEDKGNACVASVELVIESTLEANVTAV